MAIVESLKKAVDFVMDGFRDSDDVFDEVNDDYGYDEEYTEPGQMRSEFLNLFHFLKEEWKVKLPLTRDLIRAGMKL